MKKLLSHRESFSRREVAAMSRLDGKVLDYWEKEFGGIFPQKGKSGDKIYSRRDVETIFQIKCWLIEEKLDKRKVREMVSGRAGSRNAGSGKKGDKIQIIRSELKEILTILDKNDKT